jgi:hypothetical protein
VAVQSAAASVDSDANHDSSPPATAAGPDAGRVVGGGTQVPNAFEREQRLKRQLARAHHLLADAQVVRLGVLAGEQ